MKKLGGLLLDAGVLTEDQLHRALVAGQETGERLGEVLVRLGFATERDVAAALAHQLGLDEVDLSTISIDEAVLDLMPERIARRCNMIPIKVEGNRLTLAMADPTDLMAEDVARTVTGFSIVPVVAAESAVASSIEYHYQGGRREGDAAAQEPRSQRAPLRSEVTEREPAPAEDVSAPRLVDRLIADAVKKRASDIHVEPTEDVVHVRYRVDGILRDAMDIPPSAQSRVISRIKVMADMDISEKRRPQDGRANVVVDDRQVDLRISVLPTLYGEKALLRLFDRSRDLLHLEALGFSPGDLETFRSFLKHPQGLLLCTGPTGAGKTTTAYAVLNELQSEARNVVTVEDPVEYHLQGVNQVEVDPAVDLTFAAGLRSVLRQDPEVLMLGEIRDPQTAEMAFQAALTGHFVVSTLHTGDAPSAVTRLLDLGLSPLLLSAPGFAVVAQNLVRQIHDGCKESYEPDEETLYKFGLDDPAVRPARLWRGRSCAGCDFTGYRGRIGVFQVLEWSSDLRELVSEGASSQQISQAARARGMGTLLENGLQKVLRGVTTLEEVERVVEPEEGELRGVSSTADGG